MKPIRIDGKLDYILDRPGFVHLSRDTGYVNRMPAGKDKHSFVYTVSGRIDYDADGRAPVIAPAGTVVYIPKDLPYTSRYMADNTTIKLITFDLIRGQLPDGFDRIFSTVNDKFDVLFDALRSFHAASPALLVSRLYELMGLIETQSEQLPAKYAKLAPALYQLQRHYYENRKVAEYARMCFMSESNFRKQFSSCTGQSLIEYRNHIRLSQARRLIASGEFSVEEAAHRVGFNNMSFFYELYRKHRPLPNHR